MVCEFNTRPSDKIKRYYLSLDIELQNQSKNVLLYIIITVRENNLSICPRICDMQ
jgi:hypothetical protein